MHCRAGANGYCCKRADPSELMVGVLQGGRPLRLCFWAGRGQDSSHPGERRLGCSAVAEVQLEPRGRTGAELDTREADDAAAYAGTPHRT